MCSSVQAENLIQAADGVRYIVVSPEGSVWESVLAVRSGNNLVVHFDGGTRLTVSGFFDPEAAIDRNGPIVTAVHFP